MLPIPSIEEDGAPHSAKDNGDIKPQKPKTLPCKYCTKRFRRVEHVQRHERTHTKEKPFSCLWARCGKSFGRRDLLVRHEKLVHLSDGSKDTSTNRPRRTSSAVNHNGGFSNRNVDTTMSDSQPRSRPSKYSPDSLISPDSVTMPQDSYLDGRAAAACNLNLLSDAATHLASAGQLNAMQPMMADMSPPQADMSRVKSYEEAMAFNERSREADPIVFSTAFPGPPTQPSFDDYHLFLDDFASSSHFLAPSLEGDQSFGMWSRGPALEMGGLRGLSKPPSAFPSRFPSLQPDPRDGGGGGDTSRAQEESARVPMWKTSAQDHVAIKSRIEEFSAVLPSDFVFPSRHTLARFLEGYISGFHDHMPFLHIPTLSPIELAPELLLAILSVGAQYRFESHRGHALWYAAKAVALEQIRRRHSHEVHGLLPTPAAYSPHSTRPSPSVGLRHSFSAVHHEKPLTQETHKEPYSPNNPQSRLETIQALLLLFAIGLWGAKAILHDALSLQSQLALLIRDEGLQGEPANTPDWESWIRIEGGNRTKLIAYCFFNLCCLAYNNPPSLLTSEMNLFLPNPSRLWRAETAWSWSEVRQSVPATDVSLQDAFSRLMSRPSQGYLTTVSSLGNYVLMHALVQHIYLLKQTTYALSSPFGPHRGLKDEVLEEVNQTLRMWQVGFEQHRLRVTDQAHLGTSAENQPGGEVALDSTALLRMAYIRLYTDLMPSKILESREPMTIATAFLEAPLVGRSQRVHRAILQAIHALSLLVKVGINYVARTKSSEWSMQHSLCNLECAVLLSKWLLTLSSSSASEPLTMDERNFLDMIKRMLDETEFAVPVDPSLAGPSGSGGSGITPTPSHLAHHQHQHQHHRSQSYSSTSHLHHNQHQQQQQQHQQHQHQQQYSSPLGSGARTMTHHHHHQQAISTEASRLRQLAAAVVRLWAETFKGNHVFEMVNIMGQGLEGYADMLDRPSSGGSGAVGMSAGLGLDRGSVGDVGGGSGGSSGSGSGSAVGGVMGVGGHGAITGRGLGSSHGGGGGGGSSGMTGLRRIV